MSPSAVKPNRAAIDRADRPAPTGALPDPAGGSATATPSELDGAG
jgi:hypothetical protein